MKDEPTSPSNVNDNPGSDRELERFFPGDSELAARMRSLDWSQTQLGSLSGWESSFKTAVSICLNSRFPMVIWWGKEFVLLYIGERQLSTLRELLSDIGMPDMDGYMLMRQVRALPGSQGGQVKAIALTAYAAELDQQQALQAGFQQHVSKPVEPETLVTAIVALTKHIH